VWQGRDRIRGASTITQQLAKNLYLSPSRNPLRKVKEAVTAVRLELALPKRRILELYLNVVEWGPGLWGIADASRAYFGVPPSHLSVPLAAALAATLPHPRSSNPASRPAAMEARRDLILARYYGADVVIPPPVEEADLPEIPLDPPPLLPAPVLESLLAADTTPGITCDSAALSPPGEGASRAPCSSPGRPIPPAPPSPPAPAP
jgi:monofunctional biosynthetic peptidoglycan transglycosylase